MKTIKRIAAILISITLGLIFVYSGYSKLLPVIETFEFSFVDSGFANWYTAPVMARLFNHITQPITDLLHPITYII